MREAAHMRTGALVVRYYAPRKSRALITGGIVATILLVYGAFELGRYRAGYDVLSAVRNRQTVSTQLADLRRENEELRRKVAGAQLARDVNQKSYADVEKNLADLQAQVLRQREELAFYRGIVSPEDGVGALRVQRFQVMSAGSDGRYKLRVVLVQSMRQEGVINGSVNIVVNGQREAQPEVLDLAALGVDTNGERAVAFSFRYFQNLEHEIALPAGFDPQSVEINIKAGRDTQIRESFPWKVQVES